MGYPRKGLLDNNKIPQSVGMIALKRAPAESLDHCDGGFLAQIKGTLNEVHPAKSSHNLDLGVVIIAKSW